MSERNWRFFFFLIVEAKELNFTVEVILTHNFKFDGIAVTVSLDVASDTSVIACLRTIHFPQSQAVFLHYHTVFRIVLNNVSLQQQYIHDVYRFNSHRYKKKKNKRKILYNLKLVNFRAYRGYK